MAKRKTPLTSLEKVQLVLNLMDLTFKDEKTGRYKKLLPMRDAKRLLKEMGIGI
jgi:hypothetical protein